MLCRSVQPTSIENIASVSKISMRIEAPGKSCHSAPLVGSDSWRSRVSRAPHTVKVNRTAKRPDLLAEASLISNISNKAVSLLQSVSPSISNNSRFYCVVWAVSATQEKLGNHRVCILGGLLFYITRDLFICNRSDKKCGWLSDLKRNLSWKRNCLRRAIVSDFDRNC